MKLNKIGLAILAWLTIVQVNMVSANDVSRYLVMKGVNYLQTNAVSAVIVSNQSPFTFVASVDGTASNSVLEALVKLPNLKIYALTNNEGDFDYEASFTNKTALDAGYLAGTYAWFIVGANDGTNKPFLTLAPDNYPSVPVVANWTDLQTVEALQPLNISWGAFTNGTTNDFILVNILSADGSTTLASTPALLTANALNGTNLVAQIPAGSLADNTDYQGQLLFVKRTYLNTTGYPGSQGVAGYFRETTFPLNTLPTPNSNGRIQFSAGNYSVIKNAGSAPITITRSGSSGAVSVDLATQGGTAIAGTDYQDASQTVNFADGQTAATIPVTVINNNISSGNHTLNLLLTNPQGGATLGNRTNSILTIVDDVVPAAGKIQFATRSNSVPEAGKFINLTLNRTGGTLGTVSVNYATADGTAIAGLNYVATSGTVVFGSGVATKTITIPILNDSLYESNEVFTVTLLGATGGAALGTNLVTQVGIVNDDFGGTFAFKQSSYVTNENSTNFLITVVRTGGTASGVTVDYFTVDGSALNGQRYFATNGTLSFGSNVLSQTFSVAVTNSGFMYSNLVFYAKLTNATGSAKVSTNSAANTAALTILDQDSSFNLSSATYSIGKAGGSLTVTVLRSGSLSTPATVGYYEADGTAANGVDYIGTTNTLSFPINTASKTFTVPIIKNTLAEGNLNFNIGLFNPSGIARIGLNAAVATIIDNESAGTVNFSTNSYSVADTVTSGSVTLVRTATPGFLLASQVSVQLTATDGTALSGIDYTNINPVITFSAGQTTTNVPVRITKQTLLQTNKNLTLTLNQTGPLTVGNRNTATLNIVDSRTSIGIQAAAYSVNRTDSNAVITLVRSGNLAGQVTMAYTTANGTATNLQDYKAVSGVATFPANTTTKTILVPLINNPHASGNRTFNFRLSGPSAAIFGVFSNAVVTIGGGITFSAANYTVNSTNAYAVVTIVRNSNLASSASVDFATTTNGTALLDLTDPTGASSLVSDYVPVSQTVNFPAGSSSQTVSIPLVSNPYGGTYPYGNGSNRWIACTLSNPQGTGAQLSGVTAAQVAIVDTQPHGTVQFSPTTYTASAAGGSSTINLIRTGGSAGTVAVFFTMFRNGDTATNGVDYDDQSGFQIFNPGVTNVSVAIPLFANSASPYPKKLTLILNTPYFGVTLGSATNAVLNITP